MLYKNAKTLIVKWGMLMLLLLAALMLPVSAAASEDAEELPEWTVMFYFCGSDLESKYGYATGNLSEIAGVYYPDSLLPLYGMENLLDEDFDWSRYEGKNKVNVLFETGGSRQWQSAGIGLEIRTDVLQRWRQYCHSIYGKEKTGNEIVLVENCQLANMASPETLTDFIRWSVQTCPAKKYALVLWDHGGGALTGLFIDELFDGDVMYLYELKQALEDSGVQLEALVIDACLMANLETAWAVKDCAHWMIASQELVPGKGTAIMEWLQELYNHPECDGKQLGRTICDMTLSKYREEDDINTRSIMTWSVIDLTKIDQLAVPIERFFRAMAEAFRNYPRAALNYAKMFFDSEEYGDGKQKMHDAASVFYHENAVRFLDVNIRNAALDALSEAVVYSVRGSSRTGAKGLSFCYPVDENAETLDIYAKNCPSAWYLAYLDAINDEWEAPEEIYETAERIPVVSSIEEFQLTVEKTRTDEGFPAIVIDSKSENMSGVYYSMYYQDEKSGQTVFLGRTDCQHDFLSYEDIDLCFAYEPWNWPAIEGIPCSMNMLMVQYRDNGTLTLYTIPVQIGTDNYYLRCGRMDPLYGETRFYDIYGAWEGYEEDNQMLSRGTTSIAQLTGRDYRILWPVEKNNKNERKQFVSASDIMRLPRTLEIEETYLPAGTYYLEYEVDDIFKRPYRLDRIEIHWDGTTVTFPEGFTWDGTVKLNWSGKE